MTTEIIALSSLFIILIGVAVYLFRHDWRYLKKRTRDALSLTVRRELVEERKDNRRKQALFAKALEEAQGETKEKGEKKD